MRAWLFGRLDENRWLVLDVLAISVGVAGGLVAVLFRKLIDLFHHLFFGPVLTALPGDKGLVLLPVLGGLVAGIMIFRLAPEIKGDGIPVVMEALHTEGGRIRKRAGLLILFASAITIGSGGSAGRDSPIAQIGASFGSLVGQGLRLTVNDVQILTICGLVAGLAGTFNAPLGSAILGMEVIIRRFRIVDSVPILISAVMGAAVASSFLGQNPAFAIPPLGLTLAELWLCFVLGLVFGVVSSLWVGLLYATESIFDYIPLNKWLIPGLGGLVSGVAGLYLLDYGIMGIGYDGIGRVLEQVSSAATSESTGIILLLVVLALVKALATASTLGSGGCGGAIGPTLYLGTMMGAAMGLIFGQVFPLAGPHVATYALLGAGALFAGAAGAPLTCIVMIPEMATDYKMLLPMMISCATSYGLARVILRGSSMYTLKLRKKGVKLDVSEAVLDRVLVRDTMVSDVVTVSPEMTLSEVGDKIIRYNCKGYPVVGDGELKGIITFDDVREVPDDRQGEILVGDVAVREVIVAYPDEDMKMIMDRLYENNVGRLPVVERENPKKLIGIVTRTDAITAYEMVAAAEKKND